jgi:hypothetical protein
MTATEVEDKARKLTRGILPERKLAWLVDRVHKLEKLTNVAEIGDRLRNRQ